MARGKTNEKSGEKSEKRHRPNTRLANTERKEEEEEEDAIVPKKEEAEKEDEVVVRRKVVRKSLITTGKRRASLEEDDDENKKKEEETAVCPQPETGGRVISYMERSNPAGKKRVVGAPKRNRKAQMPIAEQVQSAEDMARSMGAEVMDSEEDPCGLKVTTAALPNTTTTIPAKPTTTTTTTTPAIPTTTNPAIQVNASSSSFSNGVVVDSRPSFLRPAPPPMGFPKPSPIISGDVPVLPSALDGDAILSLKRMRGGCNSTDDPLQKRMRDECWETNSFKENVGDVGEQPPNGSATKRVTFSSLLNPRDFGVYNKDRPSHKQFRDEAFEEAMRLEKSLFEQECEAMAREQKRSVQEVKDDVRARGYGEALISMENFDVTRLGEFSECVYPLRSNLRCFYDHHRFTSIPILLALRYYKSKNLLAVVPSMVFCSSSCALAYIERDMPRFHEHTRAQFKDMLEFLMRHFFGVTDRLRIAPFIQQHEDYGGRLNTQQWRALCSSHFSFVHMPTAVAVPARFVTEIIIRARGDRAQRQALHLRVEEQHNRLAPDDPARDRDDAQNNNQGGKKKKERVAVDAEGNRTVIDRGYIENIIKKSADRQKQKPRQKNPIEEMLNIQVISYDKDGQQVSVPSSSSSSSSSSAPSTLQSIK